MGNAVGALVWTRFAGISVLTGGGRKKILREISDVGRSVRGHACDPFFGTAPRLRLDAGTAPEEGLKT
jgi:hypothetical protein